MRRCDEPQSTRWGRRPAGRRSTSFCSRLGRSSSIGELLQQARQRGIRGHQRREFVEGEHRSTRGLAPEALEQHPPVGVTDVGEAGQEPGDLDGERGALERSVTLVTDVVDRAPRGQHLLEQAGLAAAPAPVHHHHRALRAAQGGGEARALWLTIEERQRHGGTRRNIMQPLHYVAQA